MPKIFVSITSSREEYVEQTVLSAIANAENPSNVSFGIFNTLVSDSCPEVTIQSIVNKNKEIDNKVQIDNQICCLNYKTNQMPGLGFCRSHSIDLCPADAEYILQIDAHMIFENKWDTCLIELMNKLESKYDKPIISSILPNWYINEQNLIEIYPNKFINPYNVSAEKDHNPPKIFYEQIENHHDYSHPLPKGYNINWKNEEFYEMGCVSGHFVFSRREIFYKIPHDKRCHWAADEGPFAMRAWTRGCRIFVPRRLIAYHLSKPIVYRLSNIDWRQHFNQENFNQTYEVIKNIFLGNELGKFGSPNLKKIKEYEDFCQFNFAKFYENYDKTKISKY